MSLMLYRLALAIEVTLAAGSLLEYLWSGRTYPLVNFGVALAGTVLLLELAWPREGGR